MEFQNAAPALAEFEAELEGIDHEFEELSKKKLALEAAIEAIRLVLGLGSAVSEKLIDQTVKAASSDRLLTATKPVWMIVKEAFPGDGGTLTVPELHKIINAHGIVVSNPDAIRIAMRRKPELFDNQGGRFSLKTDMERTTNFRPEQTKEPAEANSFAF